LESRADLDKSTKAILQSLASISFFQVSRSKIKATGKEITVRKTVEKRDDWTPEYIASRERVVNNIQNLKDWWYLPTENYILVANLENKKTIREIEENLEKVHTVYKKFYPMKSSVKEVSVCRVFEERQGYLDYVGKEHEWSAGLWTAHKKELVISPMDWGSRKDKRKMLVDVVYHEGFHQYIFYATDEQHTPVWFNEGNATFFEGIKFKSKGKFEIELTHRYRRMKELAPTCGSMVPKLLKMSNQEFAGGNRENNYTLAWGLMFFLRKGSPIMKEKNNYPALLSRYYDTVLETRNPIKATEMAWKDIDMNKFAQDFAKFWNTESLIKKARRQAAIQYQPAGPAK